MDELIKILESIRPDVDFTLDAPLVDGGILTSFDVVMIVARIKAAFGVSVGMDDMEAKNFNSPAAMLALVERLQNTF